LVLEVPTISAVPSCSRTELQEVWKQVQEVLLEVQEVQEVLLEVQSMKSMKSWKSRKSSPRSP
jgi:uncharacterized protein (DUF2236 family)